MSYADNMGEVSRRAEQVIETYLRATDANLRASVRHGNVVVLSEDNAQDVLISGDIHGHAQNFKWIMQRASLDENPERYVVFQEICHGGSVYPENGGCRSHEILEQVAALKVRYPERVHQLLSNHEMAELTQYPIQKNRQLLNFSFELGLRHAYGECAPQVRLAMLGYLESCPLAVRISDSIFCTHSIPERLDTYPSFDHTIFRRALDPASDFLKDGSVFRLVWGRDYRQINADQFAQLVGALVLITGHDPCQDGFKCPNDRQLILDCCGEIACGVLVPTQAPPTLNEILKYVFRLGEPILVAPPAR